MNRYKISDKESADELLLHLQEDKPVYKIITDKLYIRSGEFKDSIIEFEGDYLELFSGNERGGKNYTIVTSEEEFQAMIKHIQFTENHAFDVETTGLNVRKDKVVGYGVCGKVGEAYYVPMFKWDKENQKLVEMDLPFDPLEPLEYLKNIITWNGSFDIRVTKNNLKVDLLEYLYADVQLMKHTVQEDGPFALKETAIELQDEIGLDAEKEANEEQIKMKENVKANGGSTTKGNFEMYKADMELLAIYGCADVDLTFRLFEYYSKELEREKLVDFFYDEEVMPLYREVTISMEDNGIKIDLEFLKESEKEIAKDIEDLEKQVVEQLKERDEFWYWATKIALDTYPSKTVGLFAEEVALYYNLPFPQKDSGKLEVTQKTKTDLYEDFKNNDGYKFLIKEAELDEEVLTDISLNLLERKKGLINISSKQQLGEICFNYLGVKPLSKTKKGKSQFNEDTVNYIAEKYDFSWAKTLRQYNKLIKIKSSYIDRFLENQEDGYYFFTYKQHGTISGRYGSDAQQLPRPMEDGEDDPIVLKHSNRIRKFFIVEDNRKFIDCDYESLEPHTFADISGDENLRNIFRKGHDFYSSIAIPTEEIKGVSADKKADNYLGKVDKPRRQNAKEYALGVPYGKSPYALHKSLEVSKEKAQELYDGYLNSYPDLKRWMKESEHFAQQYGYIKCKSGRVRHLPRVKELYKKYKHNLMDWKYRNKLQYNLVKQGRASKQEAKDAVLKAYLDYKNGINNAKNFQVQGMAASIVNRAAIAVTREFKAKGINVWCCAQIHDQLIFNVPEDRIEECKEIIQRLMENTTKLSVDLKAPPEVGINWFDAH